MSVTNVANHDRDTTEPPFGFWRRSFAMVVKEFIQLRRDRVSFAMIVMIPVMQLLLFGYAINTTPRHLPTAVLLQEDSDLARSILKALENTAYFRFTREVHDVDEFDSVAVGQGAVWRGDSARLRARSKARRSSGAVGCGRRDRSGGGRLRTVGAWHGDADCVGARPVHRRSAIIAVRDPHPCALQPGGVVAAEHRARAGRHHSDHDHADLYRTFGDARNRARHHGKPAVDADQAD